MDLAVLAGPLIGGVIGYCTNYIAVKMLFRPLKEVKIAGFTLPFTPGIIPKGKDRLAESIGDMVGNHLLDQQTFEATLLSDDIKAYMTDKVRRVMEAEKAGDVSLREMALRFVDEDAYERGIERAEDEITAKAYERLVEADIGRIAAEHVMIALKAKLNGSILARMLNDDLLNSFKQPIRDGVNQYVEEQGEDTIRPWIEMECQKIMNTGMERVITSVESRISVEDVIWKAYEHVINSKLSSILRHINIRGMIKEKMLQMDVLEVEDMMLKVMKKELNAVVNLGALIGFVLGLLNLVF